MTLYLDRRHNLKEARPWHRLTRAEDEFCYSYKYRLKCAEIRALKEAAEKARLLDVAGSLKNVVPVRTCGPSCLPASGMMLWKGGGFALVWFDGSDAPMVWPAADLQVAV